MPYAASIADLTAHAQNPADAVPMILIVNLIDREAEHAIECERGKAVGMGYGAPFICTDEQARALIALIRIQHKKYQWRFYEKGKRGWKRI